MSDSPQFSLNPQVLDQRLVNELYDHLESATLRWSLEYHRIPQKTNQANHKSELFLSALFFFIPLLSMTHLYIRNPGAVPDSHEWNKSPNYQPWP
jgi:hypothetical protein